MRAFIPAIALCAVLQATAAVQPAQQVTPANKPGQGMLHARLATPSSDTVIVAQGVNVGASTRSGMHAAAGATQPASGEEHRPTTAAMLLAAAILMTGIALRRWGAGEQ